MNFDLVIDPFGADVGEMVEMAHLCEELGFDGIWVSDHFSGAVVGAPWSRDPFVALGAMGVVTERIGLGPLVANVTNRHVVQLASAVNSLQSLCPGRITLGVGSGAAPGSRFAVEHDMIHTRLGDDARRRHRLRSTISAARAVWAGQSDHVGSGVGVDFSSLSAVVDDVGVPRIIVGASAWPTIEVAVEVADGVNVRRGARLHDHLERLARQDLTDDFEVSVLDVVDRENVRSQYERIVDELGSRGVDRYILTVAPGRDVEVVRQLAATIPD